MRSSDVAPDESRKAIPIRLTDDPAAAPYRMVHPDQTHPYRTKEVVQKLNAALPAGSRVNMYDVTAMRAVHDLDERTDMVLKPRYGPRQFSPLFVAWASGRVEEDRSFLRRTRQQYRALRRSRRVPW